MFSHDYGDFAVKRITNGMDFWHLIDALMDDKSGFINNREVLVEAYRNSNLYGLVIEETEDMFERQAWMDPIFCPGSWYLLPCLCVASGKTAKIIWTHSTVRRHGMANKFINHLNLKRAESPLPNTLSFWQSCGINDFVYNQ
jgi:hypothetical protein